MSLTLRIILIAFSVLTFIFVVGKLRKTQFFISDTLYWLLFGLLLLVFGIFPQVPIFFSRLIGIESPSNFVFAAIIFLLIVKMFLMSVKLSILENKLARVAQRYALDSHEEADTEQK